MQKFLKCTNGLFSRSLLLGLIYSIEIPEYGNLVLMGVIKMLMKKVSARLGRTVPVLVIWVFHMKNGAHPCCLYLVDSETDLLLLDTSSTIIWSPFLACL